MRRRSFSFFGVHPSGLSFSLLRNAMNKHFYLVDSITFTGEVERTWKKYHCAAMANSFNLDAFIQFKNRLDNGFLMLLIDHLPHLSLLHPPDFLPLLSHKSMFFHLETHPQRISLSLHFTSTFICINVHFWIIFIVFCISLSLFTGCKSDELESIVNVTETKYDNGCFEGTVTRPLNAYNQINTQCICNDKDFCNFASSPSSLCRLFVIVFVVLLLYYCWVVKFLIVHLWWYFLLE